MKIAANLSWLFNEAPLHQRVALAKATGFDGVEIQFPYTLPAVQLKEMLEAADLPLMLFNLPAGDLLEGGAGLAAVPSCRAAFAKGLKEALHYAAMVRPRFLNLLAGRLAMGVSQQAAWQTLIENVQLAAHECELLGIGLLVEAISEQEMPGSLISTPEQLSELLAAVNHPNLKILLDLYHMARQRLNLPKVISQLAAHIGHVQFADCPGRGAPGSGCVDFAAAKGALRENGYSGWLSAEYRPTGDTASSLAWLQSWRDE